MATPTLKVQSTALSTGTTVRIVDLGTGSTPRYVIECPESVDAMGVTCWQRATAFPVADVIAMLVAVGFLA